MDEALKAALVRIFLTNLNEPVGAGFLLDEKHLVTCAHVVADALDLDRTNETAPNSSIKLDFPLVAPGQILTAKVIAWQPMLAKEQLTPPPQGEDIAVLELGESLPTGAKPCLPLLSKEYRDHQFSAYGFPKGNNSGVLARGVLVTQLANEWVQLDDNKGHGHFVEPGFSGGPVWDEVAGGIVGLVVAADKANRSGRMIPTSVLSRAWPDLKKLLDKPATSPVSPTQSPVPVFISYAPEDKPYLDELLQQFSLLSKRQKLVTLRHSRDNLPGDTADPAALDEARLVMLLLSSAYIDDDKCWDVELARALVRREQKQSMVVPVVVRPCDWDSFDVFNQLKPLLPEGGKPVLLYEQRDVAYKSIISSVRGLLGNEVAQLRSGQEVFIETINIIPPLTSGQAAAATASLAIPSLPDNYLRRDEALGDIRAKLLGERTAVGITGTKIGLQGMGGIGKTMLATMLVDDEEVKKNFPGGIFWMAVGQNPDLVSLQIRLAAALGDTRPITDFNKGREQLAETLKDRECLLVLDDLWEAGSVNYLAPLGEKGRLLLTTRKKQVVRDLAAEEHELGLLKEEEALKFLAGVVRQETDDLPPEAKEVARQCGYLPLAMAMAGALVRKNGWPQALQKLWEVGIIEAGAELPEYDRLYRTMEISLLDLDPRDQERYLQLAVFQEEAVIPLEALSVLWGLKRLDTDELAARLGNSALVRWTGNYTTLTLHDLQRDYLQYQVKDRLPQLHWSFVEAYRAKGTGKYWEVPADGYYYQNLAYHLARAGKKEDLKHLLLNYHWLEARLKSGNVAGLLTDYNFLQGDDEVELVQEALDLSAHVVTDKTEQLALQVYGRLLSYRTSPQIQHLLEQIEQEGEKPRLRPLLPSLNQAGGPLKRLLTGHRNSVNAVAISPDGQFAISASNDKTLIVWDWQKGEQTRTLSGHNSIVNAVVFSPDGRFAISGAGDHNISSDPTLIVWDWQKGEQIRILSGPSNGVNVVAFSPDGRSAISASHDNTLIVWDWQEGNQICTLPGHNSIVNAVAISPDGQFAISASNDKTLIVWDWQKGEQTRTLSGHNSIVNAVVFSPDGQFAISASNDKTLIVWDWRKGKKIRTFSGHTRKITSVAITPDGRFAISASYDNTLIVWDWRQGKKIRTLSGHTQEVNSVVISPDGRFAISTSHDNTLNVWDWRKDEQIHSFEGHFSQVNAVAISSNGRFAISGSGDLFGPSDNTIIIWSWKKKEKIRTYLIHRSMVNTVLISPDGRFVISASNRNNNIIVGDWKKGGKIRILSGHSDSVNVAAISPDGQFVISASNDNTIIVWDWQKGEQISTFSGHLSWIYSVAMAPDNRFAISSSADKTLIVWDWKKAEQIRTLHGHLESVISVAITPDSRFAISSSADKTLIVWDLQMGEQVRILCGHLQSVNAVAITSDGRFAISTSDDKTIIVWDWQKGEQLITFNLEGAVNCCTISLDGNRIVAGDVGGRVYFLQLEW